MPKAVRSAGRFRLYGEGTIERLLFIQQMQGLGFSLREVGELIQLRERKSAPNFIGEPVGRASPEVVKRLATILSEIR